MHRSEIRHLSQLPQVWELERARPFRSGLRADTKHQKVQSFMFSSDTGNRIPDKNHVASWKANFPVFMFEAWSSLASTIVTFIFVCVACSQNEPRPGVIRRRILRYNTNSALSWINADIAKFSTQKSIALARPMSLPLMKASGSTLQIERPKLLFATLL